MIVDPDGKSKTREFGNIMPSHKPETSDLLKPNLDIREEQEPLVDVASTNNEVEIVAELGGVKRENVELYGTTSSLKVSVDIPKRRYYKEIELPAEVDPKGAKSSCKNGVLEITMLKIERKKKSWRTV